MNKLFQCSLEDSTSNIFSKNKNKTNSIILNDETKGKIWADLYGQVPQSVERRTLDVEVRGSKPAPRTGGGVGSHLTSPIWRDD